MKNIILVSLLILLTITASADRAVASRTHILHLNTDESIIYIEDYIDPASCTVRFPYVDEKIEALESKIKSLQNSLDFQYSVVQYNFKRTNEMLRALSEGNFEKVREMLPPKKEK